jgi:poly(hydroxyalkanoate) depolymerase family esterase
MQQEQGVRAPRIVTGTFTGAEGTRAWRLAVPSRHDRAQSRAMLVMLHGCLQDAADIARGTRFDDIAEAEGILVLYPEQPESANPRKCWNWFDQANQSRDGGEPALLAALIAQVGAQHGADPARIHLAGVSAGAAMAGLLAVAYPERYASLSSASGIAWRAAPDVMRALTVMQQGAGEGLPDVTAMLAAMGERARAFPVLVVHGRADQVVSVRNAEETARQFVALHDALGGRSKLPSLVPAELPATQANGYTVRERQWRDAAGTPLVSLVVVDELGHAWSHGAPAGTFTDVSGPDISVRIGAFVARVPPIRR